MSYKIELATMEDLDSILALYSDRTKWFKDNNIEQWNRYLQDHPKEEFVDTIENKNFYIIKHKNILVAGFELSINSKYWNDDTIPAYYICKVVTKVGYKNLGQVIFDKCKELAKRDGKKFLRLYCLKSNQKLNDIYESHNFKLIRYGNSDRYNYSFRELKIAE